MDFIDCSTDLCGVANFALLGPCCQVPVMMAYELDEFCLAEYLHHKVGIGFSILLYTLLLVNNSSIIMPSFFSVNPRRKCSSDAD